MTDDDLKGQSKNDLIREVRRLRALLSEQMAAAPGVGPDVTVQGIVGIKDGAPLVSMRAGEAARQFSPGEARHHAMLVLDAAVEAERDAATIAFLRGTGADDQEAGGFLMAMRDHRKSWIDDFRGATA